MQKKLYGLATLTLLVVLASFAFAQAPTAIIKIEGYSPQEIHDMGWTSPRSTSLSNVGLGQVVYLIGRDSLNATVTTYAWTLTAKPSGSTTALDSTNKKQTTFKPDLAGKYTVQLVITTTGGTSRAKSVVINAGKFVGVGGMDGLPTNPSEGQCSLCHSTNFNQWTKTGHSSMLKRGIDGVLSAHYSESCIECHTTGYDDSPSAVNDGFDDVQKEVGWKFPTTLKAGNYDSLKQFYPKLAHRANIQCESCHGPGSGHLGDKSGIAMSLDEAVCGYCHEEQPYHFKNTQWKASGHASTARESQANNPSCTKCHSGWAFIRRVDPIPNDKRPDRGVPQITCAVCHDQHRADLPSQVRSLADVTLGDSVTVVTYGGLGKVCMQCHISRRDAEDYTNNPANLSTRFGPHHSNQADMLDGSNSIEYGIPIGTSGHKFAATDACVTCHMQATPASGQPGHDKIGEHTFAMSWDNGTPDPADDVQSLGACQQCHGPIKSFDDIQAKADFDEDGTIEGTRHEIEGLVEALDHLLPPRTSDAIVKANFDWTLPGLSPEEVTKRKALTKAWYNLLFVEEDGSRGVHNAGYSIALLRRSITSITTGDIGAVRITPPIKDVPNDQGKQVRLTWSKAAGDGVSTNPVTGYSVWRRVDDKKSVAGKITRVDSRSALLAQAAEENVGKRYEIAQAGSWDFVAWLPASGFEFYSIVAPTLFDSTASGIHWSVFFVTAHARSQNYESAPDSGYSVDNLAPATPSNIVASLLPDKTINLHWADPVDEDFQYFAIYRSTTSGFDPKGMQPYATLTGTNYIDKNVTVGNNYYYRFSTFDFSGNESDYSAEINAFITKVEERGGGVPTAYALEQNYPNPFNPETIIKYELPASGHVRLSIYTSLGQEVRRLVDYSQPAAYHQVVWDGRDDAGNPLPTGVYFYRLEAEKFTAIKKMVMMK